MNSTHAIRIHETGGPEVMAWEPVALDEPGPGEVLLRQTAVGLNFIDTYHRSGLYPLPEFPAILGREACYSGKELKWDDLLARGRDITPGIDTYTMESVPPCVKGADGNYPVPVPGKYNPFAS